MATCCTLLINTADLFLPDIPTLLLLLLMKQLHHLCTIMTPALESNQLWLNLHRTTFNEPNQTQLLSSLPLCGSERARRPTRSFNRSRSPLCLLWIPACTRATRSASSWHFKGLHLLFRIRQLTRDLWPTINLISRPFPPPPKKWNSDQEKDPGRHENGMSAENILVKVLNTFLWSRWFGHVWPVMVGSSRPWLSGCVCQVQSECS